MKYAVYGHKAPTKETLPNCTPPLRQQSTVTSLLQNMGTACFIYRFLCYLLLLLIVKYNTLSNLQFIIRVMKTRGMRWAGHVARVGERRNVYEVSLGRFNRYSHVKDVG
jgi:hypothetical protein